MIIFILPRDHLASTPPERADLVRTEHSPPSSSHLAAISLHLSIISPIPFHFFLICSPPDIHCFPLSLSPPLSCPNPWPICRPFSTPPLSHFHPRLKIKFCPKFCPKLCHASISIFHHFSSLHLEDPFFSFFPFFPLLLHLPTHSITLLSHSLKFSPYIPAISLCGFDYLLRRSYNLPFSPSSPFSLFSSLPSLSPPLPSPYSLPTLKHPPL